MVNKSLNMIFTQSLNFKKDMFIFFKSTQKIMIIEVLENIPTHIKIKKFNFHKY